MNFGSLGESVFHYSVILQGDYMSKSNGNRLGELLLEQGLITEDMLEQGLRR